MVDQMGPTPYCPVSPASFWRIALSPCPTPSNAALSSGSLHPYGYMISSLNVWYDRVKKGRTSAVSWISPWVSGSEAGASPRVVSASQASLDPLQLPHNAG